MSWYRRIDVRMYGDARFRSLTKPQPNGQSLWTYLLTGPHTSSGVPGLYSLSYADLASRLDWCTTSVLEVWTDLERPGGSKGAPMALADWDAHVVWVPKAVVYNAPDNPNIVKGWMKQIDLVPECDLKIAWLIITHKHLAKLGDNYARALHDAMGEQFPERFPERLRERFPKPFAEPSANRQPQPQPQRQEEGRSELALVSPPAPQAAAILMPVKEGEVPIMESEVEEWTRLYGNIDVRLNLAKMRGHWLAKPVSHRKTSRGIRTSINTWLAKESDRSHGGGGSNNATKHSHRADNEARMRNAMKEDGRVGD